MANSTKKADRKASLRIPKIRKSGDLADLQRRLWQVIEMTWTVIRAESTTLDERMKAGHLLSQAAGSYSKLLEQTDLKSEIDALRRELAEIRQSEGLRKVA